MPTLPNTKPTPYRVLIADDHQLVRESLTALLEASGEVLVVGVAANGCEAITLTQTLQPQIVILDLVMPEVNGTEALVQIRLSHPQTLIIVASVHTSAAYVHGALAAGAHGFIAKETLGAEIMDAIHAVSAGSYYLSPKISEVPSALLATLKNELALVL